MEERLISANFVGWLLNYEQRFIKSANNLTRALHIPVLQQNAFLKNFLAKSKYGINYDVINRAA